MIKAQKSRISIKIFLKPIFLILPLFLVISSKTKGPVVIKEKEFIKITDYCSLSDFTFSANDILNSDEISLNNISFDNDDSIVKEFRLNKNIIYSPDGKYYIKFFFVPSGTLSYTGSCNATVFKNDNILVSLIKDVRQHEKVLWFKDFIIFEGHGTEFSRKIIIELNTGCFKEIEMLGDFELIGKSPVAAFYKSCKPVATLGTTTLRTKNSVLRLSKNSSNQLFAANDILFPYLYNEGVSIIYNSVNNSFNLYINQALKLTFKSNTASIPFDESNYDSTIYILIKNSKIYKINNNLSVLSVFKPTGKKLDIIKEFRVAGNKVLFESLHKITNYDITSSGKVMTKNKFSFKIIDSEFACTPKFEGYVTEFGILDITTQTIYYPQLRILNQ